MGLDEAYPQYFEVLASFKHGRPLDLVSGQIAWVPTIFLNKNPQIFDFERATATDHQNINFKIRNVLSTDFQNPDRKLPVASFALSKHEEYLISKAKKRPCIFIARNPNADTELEKSADGKYHYTNINGLFVPIFGANNDGKGGFPKEIVLRSRYLMYPHFFYIKKEVPPKSVTNTIIDEGVARLDYLFSCSLSVPGVTPTDVVLRDDLLTFLLTYLAKYLKLPIDKDNNDRMTEVMEILALYWNDVCKT